MLSSFKMGTFGATSLNGAAFSSLNQKWHFSTMQQRGSLPLKKRRIVDCYLSSVATISCDAPLLKDCFSETSTHPLAAVMPKATFRALTSTSSQPENGNEEVTTSLSLFFPQLRHPAAVVVAAVIGDLHFHRMSSLPVLKPLPMTRTYERTALQLPHGIYLCSSNKSQCANSKRSRTLQKKKVTTTILQTSERQMTPQMRWNKVTNLALFPTKSSGALANERLVHKLPIRLRP